MGDGGRGSITKKAGSVMGDKSKIEWTNATWNPVRGCSVVSEGCRNCYAMQVAARFSGPGLPYAGLAYRNESGAHWTGKVKLVDEHLEDPLRWKRPRRIFVNSMSDLFHESLSEIDIGLVFSVMSECPQHTFQILTKRPQVMLETLRTACAVYDFDKPLPNVWLGVSVEDQNAADERIPLLMATPAALRWLSVEPLLGPVNLERWLCSCPVRCELAGGSIACTSDGYVDWVVIGGESGPNARPCALEWIESIVKQCQAASVPVFVKQLGAFIVSEQRTAPESYFEEVGYTQPLLKAPNGECWAWRAGLQNKKGGDIAEFPDELQVREFPKVVAA